MRAPINRLLARLSATPDAEVSDAELLARATELMGVARSLTRRPGAEPPAGH